MWVYNESNDWINKNKCTKLYFNKANHSTHKYLSKKTEAYVHTQTHT